MTTREAARPLRRYLGARVRALSLPLSYTITRDTTPRRLPDAARQKLNPP
jgi:hypothetical protein